MPWWCWVALCLCVVGHAGMALAHALPGTDMVITQQADALTIVIAVPVPELLLAMQLPKDTPDVLATHGDAIRTYFAAHLMVTDAGGQFLPVAMSGWAIVPVMQDDVGTFDVLQFTAITPSTTTTGLMLHYDAVMHRVANHYATLRQAQGTSLRYLGMIGYDHLNKETPPFALGALLAD